MKRGKSKRRSLRIEADRISFYIQPDDGLELPAVMQWMKQVFAQRHNALTGRSGHIWGDRYWSRILEGEPPEGAGAEFGAETGVRPRRQENRRGPRFFAPCARLRGRFRPPPRPTSPSRLLTSLSDREDPP